MFQLDNTAQLVSLTNNGIVTNEEAFKDMLNNVLSMPMKSFIFNREKFMDLEPCLYMLFGVVSANLIKSRVKNALLAWIPGIQILSIEVTPNDKDRKYELKVAVTHEVMPEVYTHSTSYQSYV